MRYLTAVLAAAFSTFCGLPCQASETPAEPLRVRARAFNAQVEIEVRDLPRDRADAAIKAALKEILVLERLGDPRRKLPGGVAELNAATGLGPRDVDPRLRRLLERALHFCLWSQGAHGPLGADLYALWGLRDAVAGLPQPGDLQAAVRSASCDRIRVEAEGTAVDLAAGSRVELWGFLQGYAVDRAVDMLRDRGVTNAWVSVGRIRRGLGTGPSGLGWHVTLPILQGFSQPMDEIHLQDRSMAYARFDDRVLRIGGDTYAPYIDQRNGRPSAGVEGVIVVTELAGDAQALASALMILRNREGQLRLGGLQPRPAVIWLLGDGSGTPLIDNYYWTQLKTVARE